MASGVAFVLPLTVLAYLSPSLPNSRILKKAGATWMEKIGDSSRVSGVDISEEAGESQVAWADDAGGNNAAAGGSRRSLGASGPSDAIRRKGNLVERLAEPAAARRRFSSSPKKHVWLCKTLQSAKSKSKLKELLGKNCVKVAKTEQTTYKERRKPAKPNGNSDTKAIDQSTELYQPTSDPSSSSSSSSSSSLQTTTMEQSS